MDDGLQQRLTELNDAIERSQEDGRIDETEREELRELIARVEAALDGDGDETVAEQLEASAVRFEADHPTMAQAIRAAVHTLTGYGM